MICRKCGSRAETRDCTSEERHYSLCDFCIAELKEKGELQLWEEKYKFAYKEIEGDYWELYEDRDFIAKVHKNDVKLLVNRLNELYDEYSDIRMKMYNIDSKAKSIHNLIKEVLYD